MYINLTIKLNVINRFLIKERKKKEENNKIFNKTNIQQIEILKNYSPMRNCNLYLYTKNTWLLQLKSMDKQNNEGR